MKKTIALSILSLFVFTTQAQSNRPDAPSLGIHYGVNFNGAVSQNFYLSGWLKKNMEVRVGLQFSFSENNQSNSYTRYPFNTGINTITVTQSSTSSQSSMRLIPSISLLAHPIKSGNADFYIGGMIQGGVNNLLLSDNYYSNQLIGDNYLNKTETVSKQAPSYTTGLSLVSGINYFFYKNLAIGVDGSLGFNYNIQKGNTSSVTTTTNSGTDNPNHGTTTNTSQGTTSSHFTNILLNAGGGIKLMYYIPVHKKAKTDAAIAH